MNWEHTVATVVTIVGMLSALIDLLVKWKTKRSMLGPYRGKMLVGILLATCFALGTLFGEHVLWTKLKSDIAKLREWAERSEEEKKLLLEALNQAPILQREYDKQCEREGTACVILYSDEQFRGARLALPVGEYSDLRMLAFNDTVRSIRIRGKVHAFAFIDITYRGKVLKVDANVPSLNTEFDHEISSVRVIATQ